MKRVRRLKLYKAAAFITSLLIAQYMAWAESGVAAGGKSQAPSPPLAIAPEDNYCRHVADAAADARFQMQESKLKALRDDVVAQTKALEEKRLQVEGDLAKREEQRAKARRELVDIYAKMKPDTAASQLALLDTETAAAVIMQLDVKGASSILNEMRPEIAAAIAASLAKAQPVMVPQKG